MNHLSPILTLINHFKHYYKRNFQEISKQYHLSQLEIDILLFLYNNPEYNTARDISAIRGFAKSNVSKALESLNKKGFISSCIDTSNRKIQRLTLNDEKKSQLKVLSICQKQCFQCMLNGFSKEEISQLISFFCRIDQNISEIQREK